MIEAGNGGSLINIGSAAGSRPCPGPYGTDTPMGNDTARYQMFADHQTHIQSFSPGALPTDSLAAPDLVSDSVLWLAGDESSLVTAAQIPADKGYLKV